MTLIEELTRRGLIVQMTHAEQITELINGGGCTFYMGIDATADSLHAGHYSGLTVIKRLQQAGHTPILLMGTGTTMIGDPSGRTDMRKMLTVEEINYNVDRFLEQVGKVIDLDKAIIERNGDWLMNLNYIELLRDVGVHFSVNKMLAADCFKTRMEAGLTFIELNYMIMQSYDFLHLFRKHGCMLELGGNDQWANIISGVDLIRRMEGKEAYGLTFKLLTNKDGVKMGKTVGGAVWLDKNRMPVYDFFQYWRNVHDEEVINCLKMLTFLPIEEIEAMEKWQGAELNKAKEILAYEVTKDVHGAEEAKKALDAARNVFGGGSADENMPTTILTAESFTDGAVNILDLLVMTKLVPSKGEGRRLVQQNGVSVDMGDGFKPVADIAFAISTADINGKDIIIKKGKKVFHKVSK